MKISLKDFVITAPPKALHYMISWSHSEPTEGKKITAKISDVLNVSPSQQTETSVGYRTHGRFLFQALVNLTYVSFKEY